jgi:hypothetical protein
MPHPFMTTELARQRRAALDGEARNQRLVHQAEPRPHADPERGRFAATARTLTRHVRTLLAAGHLSQRSRGLS